MNKSEVLKHALAIAESHNYKGEMLATADGSTFLNRDQSCVNAALNHARQLGGDKALVYVIDNTGDEATCRDTTAGEFNTEYSKGLEAASMTGNAQDKRKQEQQAEVKRLLELIESCVDQDQLDAITIEVDDEYVQHAISEAAFAKSQALTEAAQKKAADEKQRTLKAIAELDFPDHIRELIVDVTDEEVLKAANDRITELERVMDISNKTEAEMIELINSAMTKETVEALVVGETREPVLKAATDRVAELESDGNTLNAKDTIELINACTNVDELNALITEAEQRKTVLAARDKKLTELTAQQ